MPSRNAHALQPKEWVELAGLEFVREAWGLSGPDYGEELASLAYGVRFDFVSGGHPAYSGDLYAILGDALGIGPVILMRERTGELSPCPYESAYKN